MQCELWHLFITASINLFNNLCYSSSSVGLDQMGSLQQALGTCDPVTSSLVVFLWTILGRYKPVHVGNTPQGLLFGRSSDPVIWPSLFDPYHIRSDPCSEQISLVTCWLIYPSPWQVPLLQDSQCYSCHLSVLLMLWLISVYTTVYLFPHSLQIVVQRDVLG